MNVLDTFFYVDRPMCQIWYANVKAKRSNMSDRKTRQKPYKFDFEVEGQHQIMNMKVLVTSSYGDRPMCQIW